METVTDSHPADGDDVTTVDLVVKTAGNQGTAAVLGPRKPATYAQSVRAAAGIFLKHGFSPATVRAMDRPWSAEVAAAMEQQEAARPLHEICEAARRADCGYCCGLAGEPCAHSGTGPDGYHVAKFAAAWKAGLITGPELIAVVHEAMFFTLTTIVYDAPDGAR